MGQLLLASMSWTQFKARFERIELMIIGSKLSLMQAIIIIKDLSNSIRVSQMNKLYFIFRCYFHSFLFHLPFNQGHQPCRY